MNKGQRARKKILRSKIVAHHILYSYDGLRHKQIPIEVNIYNTEHYITRLLQTRGKYISKGFIRVLKFFIFENEEKAIDLSRSIINNIEKIVEETKP